MKKLFLLFLIPLLGVVGKAQEATTAENPLDFQSGDIWYTILNEDAKTCQTRAGSSVVVPGKLLITHGNNNTGAVTIPATVQKDGVTYQVVAVGDYGFDKASSVTIEAGVEKIGIAAFSTNANLSSITIPSTVTSIGINAFAGCSNLTTITIPESITSLPNSVFISCSSLETVEIPASVTTIGDYAFARCTALQEIVIPNSVTQMGTAVFQSCVGLKKVTLSEGVISIPASTFSGCSGLTSVTIPATVNSIGSSAFNCRNLTEVISLNKSIPALSYDSFSSTTYSQGVLKVYNSAISTYRKSSLWSNFSTIEPIYVEAQQITVTPSALNLSLGLSSRLTAQLSPEEACGDIVWEVSPESEKIVSIDNNGKVIARMIGVATVTATCGTLSASCEITVTPNSLEVVKINPLTKDLYVGDVTTMSAVVLPSTITAPIKWATSNADVATIDETTGELTAKAPGGAVITAECGGVIGKLAITVYAIEATSITLDKETLTLKSGETAKLTASVEPENVSYPIVTWETSDPNVAIVSDGTVTAVNVGTATIRAMCSGFTANCIVTVNPTPAESITLTNNSATLKVNQTLQLGATVMPETTTDKSITWTSSNTDVALVTIDGNVTALSLGTATITATCGDVSAKCEISVVKTEATEIIINFAEITLKATQTQQLTATVPEETTDKTITWNSSDITIATVSSEGVVTAIAVGSATITASCGNVSTTCQVIVEPTPAEQIVLDVTSTTVNVGESQQIKATVYPETTTDATITWSSDQGAIATVDNGTVTGVAPGTATITATCGNVFVSCTVTVLQPAKAITLSTESLVLEIGDMDDLIATIEPADATDVVAWSSSDANVAMVNEHGIVTAISIGTATITATCGSVSATCLVTVNAIEAESITLSATEITIKAGQIQQITATVLPENTTFATVTWSTQNEQVATVDNNGNITGVGAGTTTITAKCGEATASCEVTVEEPEEDEIIINYAEISLKATQTMQLEATVTGNATDKTIAWSSSDATIASVDAKGLVTAIAVGEATITASCGDLTATCKVTVEATPAEYVELNSTEITLTEDETFTLTATVYPESATDQSITWISDFPEIVTVSDEGVITAVAPGVANITAICGNVFASCNVTVISKEDQTGVEIVTEAQVVVYRVYNIQGTLLMTTTEESDIHNLATGLYIVNGKKVIIQH
ncbi:MAG: Ig-like domain-containing protein [Muribaculaceae bacterium]|nr:Ig-like domain-containing protein [Muribaculaceae bacterium]